MWRNKKQPVDERIEKESNRMAAKMYYLMTVLTIVFLVVKLCCRVPMYIYALELISLVVSGIYCIASELKYGILFLKDKDEELLTIHHRILSRAMMISFLVFITGELLVLFLTKGYEVWLASYFIIWFIPTLIYSYFILKNGWLTWGTKQREKDGKKELKKRTVMGALLFGVIMGFPMMFYDGAFHPEGLLWVFGMAAGWGILFYLIFTGFMKLSEKKADENLEKKEMESEE